MKKLALLFVFLLSTFCANADTDTLWTKHFPDNAEVTAVFSQDGQSLFTTGSYDVYNYCQFDLSGKLISDTNRIDIIKFSDDGKYFYNNSCHKFDYSTMECVGKIPHAWGANGPYVFSIDDKNDIGVYGFGSEESLFQTDSNFYFFRPSDMKVIAYITHPGTILDSTVWSMRKSVISPDGRKVAMCVRKYYRQGTFTEFNEYLEIWDSKTHTIDTSVFLHPTYKGQRVSIDYSPDGKLLAFAKSDTLFLYNTSDWSLIHTIDYSGYIGLGGIFSILFSTDNKTLYVGSKGIDKIDLTSFTVISSYYSAKYSSFIVESKDRKMLIANSDQWKTLVALDNLSTDIIENDWQINSLQISPNPASSEINVCIESNNSNELIYSISNISGENLTGYINKNILSGVDSFKVDISSLAAGVYFFNTTIDGRTKAYKFVVER